MNPFWRKKYNKAVWRIEIRKENPLWQDNTGFSKVDLNIDKLKKECSWFLWFNNDRKFLFNR
jgi:hypothetical protein